MAEEIPTELCMAFYTAMILYPLGTSLSGMETATPRSGVHIKILQKGHNTPADISSYCFHCFSIALPGIVFPLSCACLTDTGHVPHNVVRSDILPCHFYSTLSPCLMRVTQPLALAADCEHTTGIPATSHCH